MTRVFERLSWRKNYAELLTVIVFLVWVHCAKVISIVLACRLPARTNGFGTMCGWLVAAQGSGLSAIFARSLPVACLSSVRLTPVSLITYASCHLCNSSCLSSCPSRHPFVSVSPSTPLFLFPTGCTSLPSRTVFPQPLTAVCSGILCFRMLPHTFSTTLRTFCLLSPVFILFSRVFGGFVGTWLCLRMIILGWVLWMR